MVVHCIRGSIRVLHFVYVVYELGLRSRAVYLYKSYSGSFYVKMDEQNDRSFATNVCLPPYAYYSNSLFGRSRRGRYLSAVLLPTVVDWSAGADGVKNVRLQTRSVFAVPNRKVYRASRSRTADDFHGRARLLVCGHDEDGSTLMPTHHIRRI